MKELLPCGSLELFYARKFCAIKRVLCKMLFAAENHLDLVIDKEENCLLRVGIKCKIFL